MKKSFSLKIFFAFAILISARQLASAADPDTLQLSMADAESRFLNNNLTLLAEKLNVDMAKARIIQARLFPNPTLSLEQGLYNPGTGKYLDVTRTGQSIVQIQQLILLAGKRSKAIQLENLNRETAEFILADILRSLRYELRTGMVEQYFLIRNTAAYDRQISALQQLATALQEQQKKGNISLGEVVRLKSELLALQSERTELSRRILENNASLNILMRLDELKLIKPQLDSAAISNANFATASYKQLADTALAIRTDIKAAQSQSQAEEANLRLQRALAVPDVSLGGVYDRAGSYIQNYTGLTLQMDLPLSNRNQGNIKLAEYRLQQSRLGIQQQNLEVVQEVALARQKLDEAEKAYRSSRDLAADDYDRLMKGLTDNYTRRNITLLEYLSYSESFRENQLQMNNLQMNRIKAAEELNFSVGKPVLTY